MAATSMRATVTRVGNKTLVGGLFWQSLTRPRELKKEAAELAKKNKFDLFLIRQGAGVAQTGLAHTDDGFTPGMVSLAAIVAQRISDTGLVLDGVSTRAHNWIGALELPDQRWAYLAVRDDAIMPTGDFVGTKEEVFDLLEQNYGLAGWTAVVGTQGLDEHRYHNFVSTTFEEFLNLDKRGNPRISSDMSLRPFKFSVSIKTILMGFFGMALVVGAIAGWMYWKQEKEAQNLRAAMEAARQETLAKERLLAANSVLPHPWASTPLAEDMAAACESGMALMAPAGWRSSGIVCTTSGITYSLDRADSTVGQLRDAESTAQIDQIGDKAVLTRGVKFRVMRDEPLGKAGELKEQLLDTNQRIGIPMKTLLVPLPEPKKPLPGETIAGANEPLKPDWQTYSVVVGPTGFSPTVIATNLDVPGFRFDKIMFKEGEWTYEGFLYAR